MPSRGSAAPSDCGTGGGGGVSGQMADTHTSNWLLAVAQRVDEIMIRRQTLMEETTVFAEESARLDDESTGLGVLVEAARMDSNATLTGSHDMQTLQTRLGAMDEGQGRRAGRRASRLHREMSAIAEKLVMLDEEMLALTAEMAHFCETNPVAARSAGGTETNLPPRTGPFQTGGDAAPSGRAATGDAPPAQNDAKVVVADGESHSREGLSEPMSACGTRKLFGTTTGTTAVVGSDPSAGESRRVVRETSTPLECSSSAYDGGRSSDGLPIWNDRAWISGGSTNNPNSSLELVVRCAACDVDRSYRRVAHTGAWFF